MCDLDMDSPVIERARSESLVETGSEDDDFAQLSWKEKYGLQEKQMDRIREQTRKVRELLNIKMTEYENRVVAAEKKRDEALEKLEKAEIACEDKDEAISALREKIARMREERTSLLLLDDEKMLKIKEWVKTKFTGLFQELEFARKERDELQERISKDKSRREYSEHSITSHTSHFYEEVFSELIDGLKKSTSEDIGDTNSYERISVYCRSTSELAAGLDAPFVPPRRSSIRDESLLIKKPIPAKRPIQRTKSPEVFREMFNLPEDPKEMGSFYNLSDKMLQLSTEDDGKLKVDENDTQEEPTSPLYYSLNPSVTGANYEEELYSAPVYSTLEGMASLIRDCPFTGDTSDSEVDQESMFEERTANNLPIKDVNQSIKSESSTILSSPVLKTCAPYTAQNMRRETLEKAGFLTKLGGRVKNWKRRWFVLSNGKLSYYKSRSAMYGKPVGWVIVKQISQISKSEKPLTLEVTTPNRTYYLTADNKEEVNDWLKVLKNAMKRFNGARLMSRAGEKSVFSGWLTKAKCGSSKHCWAVLKEKSLLFYKTDVEQAPVGAMSLREIISVTPVEEPITASQDIDSDGSCKLMVQCLKDNHPTYFVVASRSEMELWLHHLQRMCSGTDVNNETDFEAIVTKLMNIDGDSGSRYWRNKIMVHSKQLIKESLSSLPTTELEGKAISLWKSIQLFSTTPVNETAIDYHIALAQDVIQSCLTDVELQTEIYCQLIKQTSKYRGRPQPEGSAVYLNDWTNHEESGYGTIDLNPVSAFVYLQCWQLLALCTSIFLPKLKILWLLKAHLHKNASESSDVGRYAIYCQRSLERTLKNGERETKPSRMEAIALIARNPFYRIFPMSIPVYFVNNSYQVFSFDGSTTVFEFNNIVNQELGLRNNADSGYSLYSDHPVVQTEHCLQGDLKLCDVVSKWEQACHQLKTGRFERSKAIKLTYKSRLFFKSLSASQTDKEKYFMVFQTNEKLRRGHLLPSSTILSKLSAYFSQIAFGDYVEHFKLLEDIMQRIYPGYVTMEKANIRRKVFKSVADAWSGLKGRSVKDCSNSYLSIAQTVPLYTSKLFKAQESLLHGSDAKEQNDHIWIAVDEDMIQILSKDLEVKDSYEWPNVVTFGGFKEDFMLVVQKQNGDDADKTTRHLFAMPPGRVLEVTLLIASYINAVVQRRGLNLDAQGFAVRGGRLEEGSSSNSDIHLWDMESEG